MNGRRWLVTVAVCAVAVVVISGSRSGEDRADDKAFRVAREHFDSVLVTLDARLARLNPTIADTAADADPMLAIERLRERRSQISTTLQSLESASAAEQLGALAGLRASLADLEYRVDLAELANASGIAVTDSLILAWLQDADERLAAAERIIADSVTAAAYSEPLRTARDECGRLESRFASIQEHFADDLAPRHSLGHELAEVRRQVRATVRAMPSSSSLTAIAGTH